MIDKALRSALENLARTERLLVAMDFDGTMSPLVPKAEDARPLPETATAFAALAGLPRTRTALISGRALDSLRLAAGPPENTLLIGSHGAESWFGPGTSPLQLSPQQQDLLDHSGRLIRQLAQHYPGVSVEYKPAGIVLHTRQASDEIAQHAVSAARRALARLPLNVHEGKRVLEASVLKVDKGQGLELLRERSTATAVLFAGDDATDENGFRVLRPGDVGVKVGKGSTVAGFRIASVQQTAELLKLLLEFRRNTLSLVGCPPDSM